MAYLAHRKIGGFGRLRSAWFTWRYRNEQLPAEWRRAG